ncbi:carbohydrate ABC transporter permease [Paenibacillus radicis (ex Xue et al. 2023)]|uniref:Carbohydrate ABC transporter permease n=1 Tax=Paenibacillus radicis (ex Xue et al. 2023) TaxID=2972489 RepID=A0ABT1Y9V5_9BACL|nr:carbohydrate ABC transporter permease [Paenibacillus radicis (ex Xue et al. 2023)]MCR8629979.1 carbohydrate ABC transporter permease [Paenibacillus radicis (ex Xue et al. 2023)]
MNPVKHLLFKREGLTYALLLFLLFFFLFPIYWIVVTSVQNNSDLMQLPPKWIPVQIQLTSYMEILRSSVFLTFYKNTFIVALGATILCIFVAIFAGYALSRFRFRGSNLITLIFLSAQMFPTVTLVIGLYSQYQALHLLNTLFVLVLASTMTALPFCIMLMRTFFNGISKELEEAAEIDGASRFKTLFMIIVPLAKPGIMAVAIYTFLIAWDDFLFGLTLVSDIDKRTLSPGLSLTFLGEYSYNWSGATAAAVTATLPLLIAFMFLQRYMVEGLTAGGVKE